MDTKKVTVTWFDQLKGFGEGKDSNGRTIFLLAKAISNKNIFKTLKPNEIINVTIAEDENLQLYSFKIKKGKNNGH
jgi:cold shock CspA family protein